jgi:hypothetical protein
MPVCTRKAPTAHKPTRHNTDDTDSEDDANVEATIDPINAGMDEWKTYLNTVKDIPDGMGIVCWWGVCYSFFLCACVTNIFIL